MRRRHVLALVMLGLVGAMAKFTDDSVLDAALAEYATATRQTLTSAQPANFAGIAAVLLGSYTITAGLGGGDFGAAANGDVSGRKTAVGAQTGNNATATGTGNHVNLDDATTLLGCTTCPNVSTNSGQPFDVAAYDIEFEDVTP